MLSYSMCVSLPVMGSVTQMNLASLSQAMSLKAILGVSEPNLPWPGFLLAEDKHPIPSRPAAANPHLPQNPRPSTTHRQDGDLSACPCRLHRGAPMLQFLAFSNTKLRKLASPARRLCGVQTESSVPCIFICVYARSSSW